MPAKKSGKSSMDYYKENPESYKKKLAAQKKINAKPAERARRTELKQLNREADKKGIDRTGKDYDHATKRYVAKEINRGRTGKGGSPATSGDRRSRGGGKK